MAHTKKILLIAACFALLYSVFLVQDTYSKYRTDANANTNITIAKWKLLVNNQDIKEDNDFSRTITPVFSGDANTKAGIIAPNAEGYFDVVIDGTDTDVTYKYTLSISVSSDSVVQDLAITHYTVNSGDLLTFSTNNYVLEETVPQDATSKVKSYRFFVKWIDGDGETMDNEADTNATTSGNAKFDVNISFVQVATTSS